MGAELGADAVKAGMTSTIVGFVAILVFMVLAYGLLFGGISVIASGQRRADHRRHSGPRRR